MFLCLFLFPSIGCYSPDWAPVQVLPPNMMHNLLLLPSVFFYFFQSRERIADEVKIVGAFQSFHCFPYCCCCSIIIFFPFWFLPSERMWKERKKREKKIEFPLGIHCNKGNSEKKYIHTQRLNGAPSRVQVIRHNVLEIDYCRETRAK